jgi:hypothetical protein
MKAWRVAPCCHGSVLLRNIIQTGLYTHAHPVARPWLGVVGGALLKQAPLGRGMQRSIKQAASQATGMQSRVGVLNAAA